MNPIKVVLISTYELGRQPFGLASPAAWLEATGASVACLDLAVQSLDEPLVAGADLVALYVPMHTATRLAAGVVERVRRINPVAHICFYGLYAPVNEGFLRKLGADTILGGEFEAGLAALVRRLERRSRIREATRIHANKDTNLRAPSRSFAGREKYLIDAPAEGQREPTIDLAKQIFLVPDRSKLPSLQQYAHLIQADGRNQVVGYTEASRGCKHRCRHCPIVPVYNGIFRVVQANVVLEDIRRQVALGARHITFGDPDFFNGPGHAMRIVGALHAAFPDLTYDVTIKIEHLLRHARHLPALRDTGCLFVTSAVESIDDAILEIFDKQHTRADLLRVVNLFQEHRLTLVPTFVTFTPWTSLEGYLELLALLHEYDLVENVAPIQYAIRLLIPAGSRLLELPAVRVLVGPFDEAALCYRWAHPDPRVDRLHADILSVVKGAAQADRREVFSTVWRLTEAALGVAGRDRGRRRAPANVVTRAPVPRMSEPWFC